MKNMKTKVWFLAIAVLAGGALGVSGWLDFRAKRAAECEAGLVTQEMVKAETDLRRTAQRLGEDERERTKRKTALTEINRQLTAEGGARAPVAQAARRPTSILEIIRNDPTAENHYLAGKRADLAATYGPFFRSLGLSAEASAKFQDAFIKREETRMDLADVLRSQGTEASGKTVAALQAKADAEYEVAQRELLGEAGYAQLRSYERTSWMRQMVSAAAGVAVLEHAPFSPQQAEALVQVIASSSKSYQQGGSVTDDSVDWEAVLVRAKSVLTSEQFTVLTTMDPGPSRGGLLQRRMYTFVERVNQAEAAKSPGK